MHSSSYYTYHNINIQVYTYHNIPIEVYSFIINIQVYTYNIHICNYSVLIIYILHIVLSTLYRTKYITNFYINEML